MQFFVDRFIKRYVVDCGYKRLCEVGVSRGEAADKLPELDFSDLALIDPCVDEDLPSKYKNIGRVRVFKGLSLEILPKFSEVFDCILLDGDHNWYTVFNELTTIDQRGLLRNGGTIFCMTYAGRMIDGICITNRKAYRPNSAIHTRERASSVERHA
jgi:hypothetical protein